MIPSVLPTARVRRDWLLLPLIGIVTIGIIAGGTEYIARHVFASTKSAMQNCILSGVRGVPGSRCTEKTPETGLVDYQFNSCGHRAGLPCGPPPPGVFRIVMIGSSMAMGWRVQREDSFAALLPQHLSRTLLRPVELYNVSLQGTFSHNAALRFNEVLAAQPDMILWAVTPGDVEGAEAVTVQLGGGDPMLTGSAPLYRKAWYRLKLAIGSKSLGTAISDLFGSTRTSLLLRHYVYRFESPQRYLGPFFHDDDLVNGDFKAQFSPHWQALMKRVDLDAADMEMRASAAGIPFVATMLPTMAQAFMISSGDWPPEFNPFKIDEGLRAIVESHGGIYVDVLPELRGLAKPARYYFPVDTHPNEAGHALLAGLLAAQLTSGAVSALKPTGGLGRVATAPES